MTRAWIRGDAASQPALLPADPADLLPAGHRAWAVLAFVAELDLSEFVAAYRADGRGRPPYDPAMMLALILYTHTKGIVSGQDIAQACVDDLGARVICGGLRPDRSAINRFRAMHQRALRGLLAQTVRIGHAEGLVDASFVAGDGTKMGANAAMGADVGAADLPERIAAARAEAVAAQAGAGGAAAAESLFGEAGWPPGGWARSRPRRPGWPSAPPRPRPARQNRTGRLRWSGRRPGSRPAKTASARPGRGPRPPGTAASRRWPGARGSPARSRSRLRSATRSAAPAKGWTKPSPTSKRPSKPPPKPKPGPRRRRRPGRPGGAPPGQRDRPVQRGDAG
jgi:transposase